MKAVRRNQRTTVSALVAAVFVLAFPYPCSPGTAQPAASAHDCCALAAGIHAAQTECCADQGAAASKATTTNAAPAPTVLERIPVAVIAASTVQLAASGLAHPRTAPYPPLVLRV
jgi:hypothetical protein